jgi:hypothetical protein
MIPSNSPPSSTRVRTLGLLLLLSCLLLPILAYIGGRVVVGPYEGSMGLLGYLGAVLSDAVRGRWLAWVLVLAPAATVALWRIIGRISKRTPQ